MVISVLFNYFQWSVNVQFFVVIPLRSLRKLSFTSTDTQVILKIMSEVLN